MPPAHDYGGQMNGENMLHVVYVHQQTRYFHMHSILFLCGICLLWVHSPYVVKHVILTYV
jgi:hypothetical protein